MARLAALFGVWLVLLRTAGLVRFALGDGNARFVFVYVRSPLVLLAIFEVAERNSILNF